MKKIVDEFTNLKVSRQRKHQLRKIALGLCMICPNKLVTKNYCRFHAEKQNDSSRRYYRDIVKPRRESENETK